MKSELITINKTHLPGVKVGDMILTVIYPDVATSLTNVNKVTSIQEDGVIRVSCINKKCKKEACTYIKLLPHEMKNLKIDNSFTKSKRVGGMTM